MLIGWQKIRLKGSSGVRSLTLNDLLEQRLECAEAFADECAVFGSGVARTELGAGLPQAASMDEQDHPVQERAVVRPRGAEEPGIGVLDGAANVLSVAVEALAVGRIEDRLLVVLQMRRRKYAAGIERDVGEIARRREMADAGYSPALRAGPNRRGVRHR